MGKSLYGNTIIDKGKYFNLSRILLYDKYHKQKHYHKERIPDRFAQWKRLKLTFELKGKFLKSIENESINEAIAVLDDMAKSIGAVGLVGISIDLLAKQIQMLKDLRHRHTFKAWVKEVSLK